MEINPDIFKAYDIRGIYPRELDEEAAFKIGYAFVLFLKKKQKNRWKKIVVGRDNRLSGPALRKSVVNGIRAAGADVIDIGLTPTPMFYFAVAHYGFNGGIQVSASHNPSDYNGLKVVRKNAIPVSGNSGLQEIRKIANKDFPGAKELGRIFRKNVMADYLSFQLKDFDTKKLQGLKVVVDTANAVPGFVVGKFINKLGIDFVHLNASLDGRFPSHPPDPLRPENLRPIQDGVKKYKADLGISFDGDGDRIIFCDENGGAIPSDIITALMATIVLRDNPGSKIAYDVRSSRLTEKAIRDSGGVPRVSRVGHSFIKAQMRKEDIIFAGEFSGHFYYKNHYFCEAPLWVFLSVLQEIVDTGKPLSSIVSPSEKYFNSGELNFEVGNRDKAIKKLEHRFRHGKISRIDGVRIDFKDWWFLVRPSNTEPVLRLAIEAKTKKLLEERKKELTGLIRS